MKGPKSTRRDVVYGLVLASLTLAVATCASTADGGEKRGEIGIQLGVRWVDRDIVPEDSNGLGFVYGLEGAWALSERWALFADLNFRLTTARISVGIPKTNAVFLVGWGAGVGSRH